MQLIKAAFVAVLETRSVGSTWLQREREKFELRSISEIYKQDLRRMLKKKNDAEEKTCKEKCVREKKCVL